MFTQNLTEQQPQTLQHGSASLRRVSDLLAGCIKCLAAVHAAASTPAAPVQHAAPASLRALRSGCVLVRCALAQHRLQCLAQLRLLPLKPALLGLHPLKPRQQPLQACHAAAAAAATRLGILAGGARGEALQR